MLSVLESDESVEDMGRVIDDLLTDRSILLTGHTYTHTRGRILQLRYRGGVMTAAPRFMEKNQAKRFAT
jgi:hypothetical protein